MRLRLPQLSPSDLGRPRHRLRNPILEGKLYVFRQPLFDFYGVTVNVALTRQNLFQVPVGQSYTPSGGTAFTKTEWHTNMTQAGVLPSPEKFFIKAISLAIRSDTGLADAHRFLYDTKFDLKISGRSYLVTHGFKLPASGGLFGNSSAIVANGVPDVRAAWVPFGDSGEVIEQLQGIVVELDPTRVTDAGGNTTYSTATTANGGAGINAFVHLDGLLHREVL